MGRFGSAIFMAVLLLTATAATAAARPRPPSTTYLTVHGTRGSIPDPDNAHFQVDLVAHNGVRGHGSSGASGGLTMTRLSDGAVFTGSVTCMVVDYDGVSGKVWVAGTVSANPDDPSAVGTTWSMGVWDGGAVDQVTSFWESGLGVPADCTNGLNDPYGNGNALFKLLTGTAIVELR
jgi:hypothetical protein